MHVNLSSEIEQYLQSKVESGFYGNASEVVRDAIRRMRQEDEKLMALQAAVRVGDEQLERGEGVRYTLGLVERMTQKALTDAKSDKAVNPDVLA
jgi:antitoxin ParD1/3/4